MHSVVCLVNGLQFTDKTTHSHIHALLIYFVCALCACKVWLISHKPPAPKEYRLHIIFVLIIPIQQATNYHRENWFGSSWTHFRNEWCVCSSSKIRLWRGLRNTEWHFHGWLLNLVPLTWFLMQYDQMIWMWSMPHTHTYIYIYIYMPHIYPYITIIHWNLSITTT